MKKLLEEEIKKKLEGVVKSKGKIKKITISAIHIKADGTKKDLGTLSETEVK